MKLKPELEEKARANQGTRTDLFLDSEKRVTPINTTKELAKAVGIGTDTMSKAIRIKESNLPALEAALDDGTLSIHKGYSIVKQVEQLPEDQRQKAAEAAVQAIKSGLDAAWDQNGDYIPTDFYHAVAQNEIQTDLAGSMIQIMMNTPPEDRDEMAERMIQIAQDVREKDRKVDAEYKAAKIINDAFLRACLVEATRENVRCYLQYTCQDEEGMELSMKEAYDIARTFNAIGDLIKNEFLPKHWRDRQEVIDVESRDAS